MSGTTPDLSMNLSTYTQCTLTLRPVKLLFVIFGRLSYSFFVRVWANGRLSHLTLKNSHFSLENERFLTIFFAQGGSNDLYHDFLSICSTKDCIYNFTEFSFRKNERSKQ